MGAGAGLFLLIVRLWALFMGDRLRVFDGRNPDSPTETLNAFSVWNFRAIVSMRTFQLLGISGSSSLRSIVMRVW